MNDGRSFANGNGNSHANGNVMPVWLRHDWQFREAWESRYSFWTVMA